MKPSSSKTLKLPAASGSRCVSGDIAVILCTSLADKMISRHPAVEHTERASVAILSQLHHLQGVDEAFLRWKRANSY